MSIETMTMFERDSTRPMQRMMGQRIVETHQIGCYQFIETESDAPGRQHFFPYVDGRSTGNYESSLDAALIVAIAYRYDGANSQAAHYFARMIGMERE